jgi:hypothetical protein
LSRVRIPERFDENLPAGDYEVTYVMPSAGLLQIARSSISLGQKEKPQWSALQRDPGVRIECPRCLDWFAVDDIPLEEVRGWRCSDC